MVWWDNELAYRRVICFDCLVFREIDIVDIAMQTRVSTLEYVAGLLARHYLYPKGG